MFGRFYVFFVKFCIKQFWKYFQRWCHIHVFNLLPQQVQATTVMRRTHKSTFCHSLSQGLSILFATWNQISEVAYECYRISATDSRVKIALPKVLIRSGNERAHDNNCLGKGNLPLHYIWGRHINTATNNMRKCTLTEPSSRNLAK